MAGGKRGKSVSSKLSKLAKLDTGSQSNSLATAEGKQKLVRGVEKSRNPRQGRCNASSATETVRVNFDEDDQYVEMEVEGQLTDFINETDTESQNDSVSSDEKGEIVFNTQNSQENNNASIAERAESDLVQRGRKQVECVTVSEVAMATDDVIEDVRASTSKLIDGRIDSSMSKMRDFFEEKFANISKVMQLEKQLAENKRKLETLKSKGKASLMDDSQSELTIYQNAVEKRGSSCSEDDIIDFSCVDQLHDTSVIVE